MRTIGVDTGGTFTDLVRLERGRITVRKVPSTPRDPARAVLAAIEDETGRGERDLRRTRVVHGTTVGLNALLEDRAAPAALVTGAGFRDLLEIGRQDRPELYALHPERPAPPIPRERRFELPQRSWPAPATASGAALRLETVREPTAAELERLRARVRRSGARSVAVCLLHSFADPEIERRVARALEPLGLPVTCSADLVREFREVERFSTAVVNAALVPIVRDYLGRLARGLAGARLELLQSSGGTLAAEVAGREPVRVLLSGPAGGVIGAARAAHQAGFDSMVGLDIGGTSADVSFRASDGTSGERFETPRVAGHLVAVPALDIHTIGCGGGSLVTVDAGGVLRVGPESAGAEPGPACYGRGEEPTLTDAHLVLGHLPPRLLGGELELDVDASKRAFDRIARALGTDRTRAAEGAVEVARAGMRRALGVMTMQRGVDPARLPLVGFGGAGGLHAAALAEALGMAAAVVPGRPGVLSALGMTSADAHCEVSESVLAPLAALGARARRAQLGRLEREARAGLAAGAHPSRSITFDRGADLRYAGQSFELRIPDAGGSTEALAEAFHRRHEVLYGYRLEREVELVTLRVRALVRAPLPRRGSARARPLPAEATLGERRLVFGGRPARARVLDRAALVPGHHFEGPAVVEEYTATTLVPPGARARVTAGRHLHIA